MKSLILNSGVGRRMGALTENQPKCMVPLATGETILSRQIRQLEAAGIREILITTGPFAETLQAHAQSTAQNARLTFVHNPRYAETNYIYSIWLARRLLENTELLSLHGDLVFEPAVLTTLLARPGSAMVTSTTQPLPEKDFKAVVENGLVTAVGVDFFENARYAQPLYRLTAANWGSWLAEIDRTVRQGETGVYAENALNRVSQATAIEACDIKGALCAEIDNDEDLDRINRSLTA